ncbi:hypothetical protein [Allorhodopirellula heiligendammensis]|uniref:Uncharacterized protein n=1 Tax=Allorhodopirellula heiligendammensis TaxID=2714739 RepID=A0A5C6C6E0_9BACT|nr:hypothetical protein [Allorhodopirellula heiligendammensis]TWU19597.1 hypothetical protein Poly21_17720 [Allorhodopirellula heiligendammensis]
MAADSSQLTGEQEIACQSCGAVLHVSANVRSTTCPYCASPSIIHRPPGVNRPEPTFLVAFTVNHDHASAAVRKWISRSSIFARSDFKRAVPKLTHGVYLPAYLYGAVTQTEYSARIGENYTETETYTTTDSNGRTVTRTRTVTKTEYRSLQGRHQCYVVDVLVTASSGVSNAALEAIEPYDLRSLRAYADSFISGWLAEEPSRSKQECLQFAHNETLALVNRKLSEFMPGDSSSITQSNTNVSNEVIDLVLLPVWSYALRYADDRPPIQILVNGQTGRVGGTVPVSTTKIALTVLAVVIVCLLLFALISMTQ